MIVIVIIIIIVRNIVRNKCISKTPPDINITEAGSMVDISKMIEVIFETSTGYSKKVVLKVKKL